MWAIIAALIIVLGGGGGVAAYLLTRDDGGGEGTATSKTLPSLSGGTGASSGGSGGSSATGSTDSGTGGDTTDTTGGGGGTSGSTESTDVTVTTSSTTTTTTEPKPAWTQLDPPGYDPQVRSRFGLAYDAYNRQMLVFGGMVVANEVKQEYNDTWAYDAGAGRWTNLHPNGASPSGRFDVSLVYLDSMERALMFGGASVTDNKLYDETWSYDPYANTWTQLYPTGDVPSGRQGHAMAWDSRNQRVILFGGEDSGVELNDTYAYDPLLDMWAELGTGGAAPSPRYGHSMVFDPEQGKIYLFGGALTEGEMLTVYGDLWEYDCYYGEWTEIPIAGDWPAQRAGHAMVLDTRTDELILFGGYTNNKALNDTWSYDPESGIWTELTPAGAQPPPRWFHGMAYDSDSDRTILFGGKILGDEGALNDTWAYGL